ncbi:MAG: ThiF family adenylyltransferase [Oscillospiraceae bacterium]|jgi:PRTRC genetic system ThiF family protein|nr:ThiF family adenylyltransferase [Oscillospiraceae bacterium]
MKFSQDAPVKIVIIGAGGTGGYIIPHLYRIAFASGRKSLIRIIVCDGDIVESKNLVRQNFIFSDVGGNKAQVLAERYAGAFGMQVEYIPHYIENADELLELVTPDKYRVSPYGAEQNSKVILIGAVDNNRSRQICHEVFKAAEDLIYIDSGNGESTGQVVCGVKQKGRVTYKPVCSLYSDMLQPDPEDKLPTEISCAERAVSAPQSVTANLMASTAVVSFMYNLLVCGELKTRYVNFSARQINMRATVVKPRKRKVIKKLKEAA